MKHTSCRLSLLAGLALLITAGLGGRPDAQSPPIPSGAVVRNTSLNGSLWPADFNGDGLTDLLTNDGAPDAFGSARGRIAVALGRGDGTFGALIVSAVTGQAIGAADMNGDGERDALAVDRSTPEAPVVVILPGHGDGTLGAARPVTTTPDFTFALTHDMNGDGRRDLVVAGESLDVRIFPGNGDFTFGSPVSIFTGYWPHGGIIADFNGDGRRDLAVANRYSSSVTVSLNQGGLSFTTTEIPLARPAMDVTTGDIDGDGRLDLFVASAASDYWSGFVDGAVHVLLGGGDGTFAAPRTYDVARGAVAVVVGDFTGDGRPDVATANRSFQYFDDCSWPFKGWDSVTVLAGAGDGTLGAATTFSLGDQRQITIDERYRNTVVSLATSDLDGDGRTDLIASQGALLFTRAPAPNRPPTVDAGPDGTVQDPEGYVPLPSSAFDPDGHLLSYRWTSTTSFGAGWPNACDFAEQGAHTYTVTVDDGHGGMASDSVVYNVDRGYETTPPSVSMTAPVDGAAYRAPAAITLAASASDADGSIRLVEFHANGIRIGADETAPYSVEWEAVPEGIYQVHALGRDDRGVVAASSAVTVTVEGSHEGLLLSDDFDDNSIDASRWVVANLFTGTEDPNVPIRETSQRIEIGPLLQASGSHYNGLASAASYDFTDASATVRLVQAPSAATTAQAFFAVGVNSSNYYRLYVAASTLYAERRIGGTKTALRTVAYRAADHQYLRLRHESATGRIVYETAPGAAGPWSVVATDTWNTGAVPVQSLRFEVKAGTSIAEPSAPGTVVFDEFAASRGGEAVSPVLLADDFDAATLDTSTWSIAVLSGLQDASIPVAHAAGRLRIGPLKSGLPGSHYNGVLSRSRFDLTGASAYVKLAAWPYTAAYAMWTVPIDGRNHYRIYVEGTAEGPVLQFEEKIGGVKRMLHSMPFVQVDQPFWRIRHVPARDAMAFETAPDAGGRPSAWTRHVEVPRRLPISGVRFELKAGTSAPVPSPGTVDFDNFRAGS